MPKHGDTYYHNLERILEAHPNGDELTTVWVAQFLGISKKTVQSRFPLKGGKISAASLAACLSVNIPE